MLLSTVILPLERWPSSQQKWKRAEELGFHAAYIYDHLSWRRLHDRPWFGAVPTLAAAAVATSTIRVGTLVTNPNFRHPVALAKDLLTLDDLSNGRLIVGVGAGTQDEDATALGQVPWSLRERGERFENFVVLLDKTLRDPITTYEGPYYSANEVRMLPGTVQQPRPPFLIAATGVKGLKVAARLGQGWVTVGRSPIEESCYSAVSTQVNALAESLHEQRVRADNFPKLLLDGFSDERPLASLDSFVDWAGRYADLGITELVVHWPEPDSLFESDMAIFERIATEGLAQLEMN